MITRAQVVETARGFLGTPFRHQGRVPGKGFDCAGVILCTAEKLGVLDRRGQPVRGIDHADYGPQPNGREVHELCVLRFAAKSVADMQPGDVVTIRIPTFPCHVGIVGNGPGYLTIIHAYNGGGCKVVENRIDEAWRRRIVGCFSFPGVE